MPEKQFNEWGIVFGTQVDSSGYSWRGPIPGYDGRLSPSTLKRWRIRTNGLEEARRAFRAFRVLAGQIAPLDNSAASVEEGLADPDRYDAEHPEFAPWMPPARAAAALIVAYANRYGTLAGDEQPLTLQEWVEEARDFLALDNIGRQIITGDYAETKQRLATRTDRLGGETMTTMFYLRTSGEPWEIAREGEKLKEISATHSRTLDWFAIARESPTRAAWMLFSTRINGKMRRGLSLCVPSFRLVKGQEVGWVQPAALGPMLYARLWLDVMNSYGAELDHRTTCRFCGGELNGTRRKQFCSDACRVAFHRRGAATIATPS